MKNRILKILIVIFAIILCCQASITSAFAENATSISVSPMIQKFALNPGEVYHDSITVANGSDATQTLKYTVEVGSYGWIGGGDSIDDYGTPDVYTINGHNEMMKWITIDKTGGVLEPNETEKINYTINVPLDAPAGAQYASILVYENVEKSEDNSTSKSETSANITSKYQLASAIIANVAGETIEKGSIYDEYMPSFLLSSPLETTSMVRNEGNIYTDAKYILQVWPLFSDEEICTNEEEPNTELVLPDTERYHTETCNLPSVGIFRAKQTVRIFGEESIVEKIIIVCPIWLLFLIIFVVVALIIWIIMRIRSRSKSKPRSDSTVKSE